MHSIFYIIGVIVVVVVILKVPRPVVGVVCLGYADNLI